jgi:hypothetical protein
MIFALCGIQCPLVDNLREILDALAWLGYMLVRSSAKNNEWQAKQMLGEEKLLKEPGSD